MDLPRPAPAPPAPPAPPAVTAILVVLRGKDEGQTFPLGAVTTLGRKDTDVLVADKRASRLHARIVSKGGQYMIQDAQSSNGTFVNNEKVAKQALDNCDVIALGSTRILVATM